VRGYYEGVNEDLQAMTADKYVHLPRGIGGQSPLLDRRSWGYDQHEWQRVGRAKLPAERRPIAKAYSRVLSSYPGGLSTYFGEIYE